LEDSTTVSQREFGLYWLGVANRILNLHLSSFIVYGGEIEKGTMRKRANLQHDANGKNADELLAPRLEFMDYKLNGCRKKKNRNPHNENESRI
jgi:hypothetical protein